MSSVRLLNICSWPYLLFISAETWLYKTVSDNHAEPSHTPQVLGFPFSGLRFVGADKETTSFSESIGDFPHWNILRLKEKNVCEIDGDFPSWNFLDISGPSHHLLWD